ncbi:choline ABC transporter substrate-binding protein [Rubellimicrobium aerolatum]|uniref:Choline ABC transporter substrate-binding protein n=1 Tax=Rubellimicrobium aerolatum TaxID=490979 RepID=A0ABW0SCC5_9RHOB|nr:choline ABC transporter substrate-binding protein [Rubellimicrobium aerolatum]MBP1806256.1 glycine betaine/proline transport system substrate-binding protein [Rubellimicrobium aerolatum]
MTLRSTLGALALLAGAAPALAQEACTSVSLSDVGWTDITATTSAAKQVLEALGYDVNVQVLSVPVTFQALSTGDLDVFLGNWMPSQQSAIQPYLDDGSIETVGVNLEGTKYNLAVPTTLYEQGLKTYEDLAAFRDQLDGEIYGIEPGNEANTYLIGLTEPGGPLEGFEIVESSEQGMLAQVRRAVDSNKPVVFLGWAPHPMNANFDIQYVEGGEDFFGSAGNVYTVTRKGFAADCPNVATLLQNMTFTLPMENEMMGLILDEGMEPDEAVKQWLAAHPETFDAWLQGVTTVDGGDGLAAVQSAMGS